jgi:hypothetical protein
VVPQGGGHGSLPAIEVVGVQQDGRPSPMKRILPWVLGGGTGQDRNGADDFFA